MIFLQGKERGNSAVEAFNGAEKSEEEIGRSLSQLAKQAINFKARAPIVVGNSET